jgi:hypothetical protein
MFSIKASKNPDENWNNDLLQFSRFIVECEALGLLDIKKLSESMDLYPAEVMSIIDRAEKTNTDFNKQIIKLSRYLR